MMSRNRLLFPAQPERMPFPPLKASSVKNKLSAEKINNAECVPKQRGRGGWMIQQPLPSVFGFVFCGKKEWGVCFNFFPF